MLLCLIRGFIEGQREIWICVNLLISHIAVLAKIQSFEIQKQQIQASQELLKII